MSARSPGWSREFDEPIPLPDGRTLVTLRDAASYITALPKTELAAEVTVPSAEQHASTILRAYEEAQAELLGKAVVLTDGKAGTIEKVRLDELHGLRISIRGHKGRWPVSTIKFAQGE